MHRSAQGQEPALSAAVLACQYTIPTADVPLGGMYIPLTLQVHAGPPMVMLELGSVCCHAESSNTGSAAHSYIVAFTADCRQVGSAKAPWW